MWSNTDDLGVQSTTLDGHTAHLTAHSEGLSVVMYLFKALGNSILTLSLLFVALIILVYLVPWML